MLSGGSPLEAFLACLEFLTVDPMLTPANAGCLCGGLNCTVEGGTLKKVALP